MWTKDTGGKLRGRSVVGPTARSTCMRLVAPIVLGLALCLVPAAAASAAGNVTNVDQAQPKPADVAPMAVYRDWYYLWIECELQGQEGVEDGRWDRYACIPTSLSPLLRVWLLVTNR